MEAQMVAKLLLSVLFFMLVQANSQNCDLSTLQINQTNLGKDPKSHFDTVFEVEVKNLCNCALKGVFVDSRGFGTSIMVDPKAFRKAGNGYYLVNDGRSIGSKESVRFKYSWDHFFRMSPVSVVPEC